MSDSTTTTQQFPIITVGTVANPKRIRASAAIVSKPAPTRASQNNTQN